MVWTTARHDAIAASDCIGIRGPTPGGLIVGARHRFPAPLPGGLLPPGHGDDQGEAQKSSRVSRSRALIALEPPMMSQAAENLTPRGRCYGGRGGGFLKARVCSRSSHESKIRKLVIDARWLKNGRRGPIFSLAARQSSSAISQVV